MKRKLLIIFLLGIISSSCFAATPAKPYADLVAGDTLPATWLMGTFDTLYTWAQGINARDYNTTITISSATIAIPNTGQVGNYFVMATGTSGEPCASFLITKVATATAGIISTFNQYSDSSGQDISVSWPSSSTPLLSHPTSVSARVKVITP